MRRAGRPDGVAGGAYLDTAESLTGCGGKLYFGDNYGLRRLDPATGNVTTLIATQSARNSRWCDGIYLYSSYTFDGGRLTIALLDLKTFSTSTFSYPATGVYTSGVYEYLLGVGSTLFTTDSAAGRIWAIDLATRARRLVADFGGPLLLPNQLRPLL